MAGRQDVGRIRLYVNVNSDGKSYQYPVEGKTTNVMMSSDSCDITTPRSP